MPKHNPQRDLGLCQQHFPASLCHASARGFASSLPGRAWMSLNLYPLPNLAEISQQARKSSGGAATRVCACTHTQRDRTALIACGNRAKEGAASSCDPHPCSAFSIIVCLVTPDGTREFVLDGLGTRSWDRARLILGNVAETSPGTSLSCRRSPAETREVGKTRPHLQIPSWLFQF